MDGLAKTAQIAAYLDAIDSARRVGYGWRYIHGKLAETVGVEDAEIFRQLTVRARKAVKSGRYAPAQLSFPGDTRQPVAATSGRVVPAAPAATQGRPAPAAPQARPAAAPAPVKQAKFEGSVPPSWREDYKPPPAMPPQKVVTLGHKLTEPPPPPNLDDD